ncbi:hypothetical protein GCM10009808_06110 [Microbacterium sediminicola]|uniref:DUF2017 domain-containing protein n=1 Tax=Microbacterium sediminicola TaxID=415210 RepID=A0ABN2HRC4_9MICO
MTPSILLEVSRIEVLHLHQMTQQFIEVLETTTDSAGDAAVRRLVPDAYQEDDAAAREFRRLTERELLDRRLADARTVLDALSPETPPSPVAAADPSLTEGVVLHLDGELSAALVRTLSAIRLVLATRLGIDDEDDHDPDDPRFGIYDWLGYRLNTLVQAIDSED